MGFMDSRMLVLAFIVLVIANLALLTVAIAPFYYSITFLYKIGDADPITLKGDAGLFYVTTSFQSMLFLEKVDNNMFASPFITLAQVFYIAGFVGTVSCTVASFLLALKDYMSVPANIINAGFMVASVVFLVVSTVMGCFPAIVGRMQWGNVPDSESSASVSTMSLNWAFYIGVLGVVLALLGAVFLMVEACKSCSAINKIRSQQLREKPRGVSSRDKEFENFSYVRTPRRGPPAPAYTVTYQSAPSYPKGGYSPQGPPAYSGAPPPPGLVPHVMAPPSPRGGYVSRHVDI